MSQKYSGFFFEANSIQSFILLGGRLRDIVGASHLLDQLCTTDIEQALATLGLTAVQTSPAQKQVLFTRRASGAIYAVLSSESDAQALAALWSLIVRQRCPGMSFNQALVTADSVFACVRDGTSRLAQSRSLPSVPLPAAFPLVERSPRTGLPVVASARVRSDQAELVDAAVLARRNAVAQARDKSHQELLPKSDGTVRWVFPSDLEFEPDAEQTPYRFPFEHDQRSVGILHADGNGLGQILLRVVERAERAAPASAALGDFLPRLSQAVADATVGAAREAIEMVLAPRAQPVEGSNLMVLPARPIVLAGDDITIILRADISLDFMVCFARAFEEMSEKAFAALRREACAKPFDDCLPERLTVCGGMVYVKNSHPFTQALHLAEDLCAKAKRTVRPVPVDGAAVAPTPVSSAIAFERLTESMASAEETGGGLKRVGVYATGLYSDGLPTLSGLLDLLALCGPGDEGLPRGPLRRLLGTAALSAAEAGKDYSRWRDLLAKERGGSGVLRKFDQALLQISPLIQPNVAPAVPARKDEASGSRWILQDLMDLLSAGVSTSIQSPALPSSKGHS